MLATVIRNAVLALADVPADWEGSVAEGVDLINANVIAVSNRIEELEREVARLKATLQRMVDWTDCQCEDHTAPECCGAVPDNEFHCPGCIAARALAGTLT
jgi:hypothetical protein